MLVVLSEGGDLCLFEDREIFPEACEIEGQGGFDCWLNVLTSTCYIFSTRERRLSVAKKLQTIRIDERKPLELGIELDAFSTWFNVGIPASVQFAMRLDLKQGSC